MCWSMPRPSHPSAALNRWQRIWGAGGRHSDVQYLSGRWIWSQRARFWRDFSGGNLSAQLGRPVQVIWDRETDIEQDQFRPAAAYRCRARLDEAGMPTDLELRIATQSLRKQLFPQFYHPRDR